MGENGGTDTNGVSIGEDGVGGYMADSALNPEREKGVERNWVSGGDVEVRGGDLTSPTHERNHLTRRPTRFQGRLRYWDSHPRGQSATAACSHEGGSHVRDLPGPDQGLQHLGQVQEPGDLGRLLGGTTSKTAAAGVLEKVHDGGTGGRVFQDRIKGAKGVTQGDPLSPTIFNVVVDVVVRQWVTLAVEEAETRGERGREGRHQAVLFYADDGMVASSDPRWLQ